MLPHEPGEPAAQDAAADGGASQASLPRSAPTLALAYVGAVVPDEPAFHGPAFNRAGQMFQREMLLALRRAGLPPSLLLSMRPLPAFPSSPVIWVGGKELELAGGLRARLLPFVNVYPLKAITLGLSTLASLLAWRWRARGARHYVVLACNLTMPPGLVTLLAARLIGATAVAMILDIEIPGETVPATLGRRLDLLLHRWLIPRFDGIAVVADAIAGDFAPTRPYIRIEGGVAQEALEHPRATRPRTALQPFILAFAGSLTETNGIPVLLDALALLEGPGYRLRIAGAGPLENLVRERAKVDPRLEFCGFLPFDQVLYLYAEADLLLNFRPTQALRTRHFFPSKLMEYLASGTPVVTTCTGHVEEEFHGMAFLLRDESAAALANLIREVAALPPLARARVADQARKYMCEAKTWDVQGRRMAAFIHRLREGKRVS